MANQPFPHRGASWAPRPGCAALAGLAVYTPTMRARRLGGRRPDHTAFAAVLRAYRSSVLAGNTAEEESLIAWLGGQPNVAAGVKRAAGIRATLTTSGRWVPAGAADGAAGPGHAGLLVTIDETETLQRVRGDVREKALNVLRQLIDEVDGGRIPGSTS